MTLSLKSLQKKRARKEMKRRAIRKEIKRKTAQGILPKVNEQQRYQMSKFKQMIKNGKIIKDAKTGQFVIKSQPSAPVENTVIPVENTSDTKT